MHRSGTTLLARVLEKAGIFMGVVKDHNFEAMHFLSLNQQSLWAADSNWLEPQVPGELAWKYLPARTLFREHFKLNTTCQRFWYALKAPPWGWKDPRNTFTLPMWLSLFPQAKVIHILRNPADVAQSLLTRNKGKGEVFDPRLDDLTFNEKLAIQYQNQGRSYRSVLGNRYLEVQYEDLIALNSERIAALEKFTGTRLREVIKQYVHH